MSNTAPAGFFSPDVNNQDASSKLPYFPPNFIGVVKVAACKGITTREGQRAFIAELEVVTSNLPETVRVGGKYSWFQSLKEPGTAYPACISFLYACLGLDTTRDAVKIRESVKPQQDKYLNTAVSEKNILGGAMVNLQTSNIQKKRSPGDFTVHNFSPYVAPAATA
jgi:hypothetical protein